MRRISSLAEQMQIDSFLLSEEEKPEWFRYHKKKE
jgi:hypothetical protein